MENLKLYDAKGHVVHTISRKGIPDADDLTDQLIEHSMELNWLDSIPNGSPVNKLRFREKYMAGCASLLWDYLVKQQSTKEIS